MPLFSRLKNRSGFSSHKNKGHHDDTNGGLNAPQKPRFQSTWTSGTVDLEEIEELVHACTAEMKSRAEALDAPFLLLPFRPNTDASHTPTFIRNFFEANSQGSDAYRGDGLRQELRLTESVVLCSIMKWCWSRMPGGVVTWATYEGFKIGEQESNMDRNAFETFVPLSVDSLARKTIVFDFFDLLAAVAAHGKTNGLGGRKLSRLAGWWAFEHHDDGKGFEGGYKSWATAADACSHLFFGYLRASSPEANPAMSLIERIPRSLQALLASTEYPPESPSLMQRTTPRVIMVVDDVSPTPFALLRRAKHFEYRDQDKVLRSYQEFDDPIDALTEECKRVLLAISSVNSRHPLSSSHGQVGSVPEESWSAFRSTGFHDLDGHAISSAPPIVTKPVSPSTSALTSDPHSRVADLGRPTTPSWADFMSSGFTDDPKPSQATLIIPPEVVLPPIANRAVTPSRPAVEDEALAPGELAAVTSVELDDAFWWVWMTSLASEEPLARKAVFGRCALVETTIMSNKWLIMEEQLKGASQDNIEDAYFVPKKGIFASLTKRGRLGRKHSSREPGLAPPNHALDRSSPGFQSKTSLAPDQQSRIKAAAIALTTKPKIERSHETSAQRGHGDEVTKNSAAHNAGVLSEATSAMKWASAYDKSAIRAQYLSDVNAGKGVSREELSRATSANGNSVVGLVQETDSVMSTQDRNAGLQHDEVFKPTSSTLEPTSTSTQSKATYLTSADIPARTSSVEPSSQPSTGKGSASPSKFAATEQIARSSTQESPSAQANKRSSVGRKPVASPKHPALRPQNLEEDYEAAPAPIIARKASAPQVSRSAAALAAAKAMMPAEDQDYSNKGKKPLSTTNGLKKMFGNKREIERSESKETSTSYNSGIARRLSQIRRKPHPSTEGKAPQLAAARIAAGETSDSRARAYSESSYEDDHAQEAAAAQHEFSRFDQGPLESMPAEVPRTPVDSTEREVGTSYSHEKEVSHEFEDKGMIEPGHFEQADRDQTVSKAAAIAMTNVAPTTTRAEPDRWAAVREEAARRAAARASEEQSYPSYQSHQSKPSQGGRTDDGETSGEETIESRVARIKARVAELTGGLEQSSSPHRR